MLYNYGTLDPNEDLSKFSGFTVTTSNENNNDVILTNYKDGHPEDQFVIDPQNDSIENSMAELYPVEKTNIKDLPLDEDGDIDYTQLPEPAETFVDKPVLVEETIIDTFEQNLEEFPYSSDDEIPEDNYDFETELDNQQAETEKEDQAFERFERFINHIQDN